VAGDPVAWIVLASGDFLNLADHSWSRHGTPHPCGAIVVADDTSELLGVYPHRDASSGD
jgi:hypothetical protein